MDFPLSQKWYKLFYPILEEKLHYSHQADANARDELRMLLGAGRGSFVDFSALESAFERKSVYVFGAGPSLAEDIEGLSSFLLASNSPVVAADGACDFLANYGIRSDICVSDLDSARESTLISQSKERLLVVHAHSDNIDRMKNVVPKFGNKVFGTTQVESKEPVINTGGYTDGDRSCYFAAALGPSRIILGGMDFGSVEGDYSPSNHDSLGTNISKLKLGKISLEFLIENSPRLKFLNATAHGEAIKGARKSSYQEIKEIA